MAVERLILRQGNAAARLGHKPRWFLVLVHPTTQDLNAAAEAYRPGPPGFWGRAAGCCHPALDPLPRNGYSGILRFTRDHVTHEIVVHEALHAACAIYRMNIHPDLRLGNGCRTREEQLAHIAGDLITEAVGLLQQTIIVWHD